MPRWFVLAALLLAACSPTLNWREVPCTPPHATRRVPRGGVPTELDVAGCEAGGATFAVMVATLPEGRAPDEVLAGWQQATLANMQAAAASARTPFRPPGGLPLAHAERLVAQGQGTDGKAVAAEAVWTAHAVEGGGTELLHAVMYAPRPRPEVADAFFAGLKLR